MPTILAIANQKGGVGKTTTAINLAASLAHQGEPVLLLDGDPQGNASSGMGVRLKPPAPTLYQFLTQGGPPPVHQPRTGLPLWLLPANAQLAAAEWELLSASQPETRLFQQIQGLLSAYTWVILDCPPSLGLLTVNMLTTANAVLIPLQCEYFAMEGLSLLLETVRKIKLRWNPPLRIAGILLTMFDRRNNLSHQVANEIRQHLGSRVFQTVIPRNVRLSEAPSHGQPVITYDRACPGTQAYLQLAEELLSRGNGHV